MIKIVIELSPDEAWALGELTKRFRLDHAKELSSRHDGGREQDAMMEGILALQRALAESGFAPR
jgi:hypothetical protein